MTNADADQAEMIRDTATLVKMRAQQDKEFDLRLLNWLLGCIRRVVRDITDAETAERLANGLLAEVEELANGSND